jgi:hypothetical protein
VHPRPGSRFRLLPIAWLLALLLLPAVGLALGARQPLLDNRPKTPFPSVTPATLRDGATFKQFDAAFFERLPPRARAVRAHTQIALDVFHDSPNPDVAIGSGGYYYYVPTLQTCTTKPPGDDPADAAEILARTFVAFGRKALVLEPAGKALIHPQDAPSKGSATQKCAQRLQARVERRLAATPGGAEIDSALRKLEAQGKQTFLKHDTHWNWRGRLLYARTVLDFLRPGLAGAVGLHAGDTFRRPGDEAAMLGLDTTEPDRPVIAQRTPDPPVTPGSAVIVGDSQNERTFLEPTGKPGSAPLLNTVLPGVRTCNYTDVLGGACDAAIAGASHVVYESVGRNLADFDSFCWRPVVLLAEAMTGPAGSYQRVDGGTPVEGRSVTVGASGSVRFRVVPASADTAAHPRLMKMVVRNLPAGATATVAQEPQEGPPAPCATPQQGSSGTSLVLPIPAGRRAADLLLQVTAPAGTVLSAPREIPLDGRRAQRKG